MILTKTVQMRINPSNVNYLLSKGYQIPLKENGKYDFNSYIEVDIDDVAKGSKILVEISCDYCNEIKIMKYCDYNKSISTNGFHACVKCTKYKIQETNMIRYGTPFASQLDEIKEKAKRTSREKYGTDYPGQSDIIKNNRKETLIEKYGVDHYSKTDEYKEKIRNTSLRKYGTTTPLKSEIVKGKIANTNLERYGYENPMQSPELREEIKQRHIKEFGEDYSFYTEETRQRMINTCREKYGVDFPTQSKEIINKIRESNFAKYGFENASQSPIIKEKKAKTFLKNGSIATSSQQRYIHNLYGGELNGVVSHYNCDIVFYAEKIIVECDFSGHDLGVKYGDISEEEFKQKEIIRSSIIKRAGFKTIRIISRKDYLPSDTILLQMLDYARTFFTQNPDRSWISFDIDNNCIYNAYHKEPDTSLHYDYGKLRKIKKTDLQSDLNIELNATQSITPSPDQAPLQLSAQ